MDEKTERDLLRAEGDLLKDTNTDVGEIAGEIVEEIARVEGGTPRRRRRPGVPRRPSGRGRPGRGGRSRKSGPSGKGGSSGRGRGKPPAKGRPSGRGGRGGRRPPE